MAQILLDVPNIGAVIEHICNHRVSNLMAGSGLFYP